MFRDRQTFRVLHAPDAGGTGGAGADAAADAGKQGEGSAEKDGDGRRDDGEGEAGPQTVNRYKYNRDIESRDKRIKELEEQLDGRQKAGDDLAKLRSEFDAYKAEQASRQVDADLRAAGCIDVVSAKARLGEFKDIAELKEHAPHLFKAGSGTGGNPSGAASNQARTIKEGLAQREK